MNTVYMLWHFRRDPDGHKHDKIIGIYTSRQNAEAALMQVCDQPGFKERPEGFHIAETPLDRN